MINSDKSNKEKNKEEVNEEDDKENTNVAPLFAVLVSVVHVDVLDVVVLAVVVLAVVVVPVPWKYTSEPHHLLAACLNSALASRSAKNTDLKASLSFLYRLWESPVASDMLGLD